MTPRIQTTGCRDGSRTVRQGSGWRVASEQCNDVRIRCGVKTIAEVFRYLLPRGKEREGDP